LNLDVFLRGRGEAGGGSRGVIESNLDVVEAVLTFGVGPGVGFDAGGLLGDLDGGIGQDRPAGIGYNAYQVRVDGLAVTGV